MKRLMCVCCFAVALAAAQGEARGVAEADLPRIAVFGGSFSIIRASQAAKKAWAEALGCKVDSYGVGGCGFEAGRAKTNDVSGQVSRAIASGRDYRAFVLWASGNDFRFPPSATSNGVERAVKLIRERAPKAKIVLLNSIDEPFRKPDFRAKLKACAEAQIGICAKLGVPCLDLFHGSGITEENGRPFVGKDNCHMTEAGYRFIAPMTSKFLLEHIRMPDDPAKPVASCDAAGRPLAKQLADAPFPKAGSTAAQRRDWAKARTEPKTFVTSSGLAFNYRWHAPAAASGKLPLVVFLHGAGERGADNVAQLIHGIPQFLNWSLRTGTQFYLVAGQVPAKKVAGDPQGNKWVQVPWGAREFSPMPDRPSESMSALIELVGKLREDPRIDASRIYVSGISMGGYGTWDLIMRHPEWFAAAIPCCGGGDNSKVALVRDLPIRIAHGGADGVVPTVRGRSIFEALKAAGGKVEYFEYPGVGHNSWDNCYNDDGMFEWLFAQRR